MAGHDLQREDAPLPELSAFQDAVLEAAVFMRGLVTYTNRFPTAYERLATALDVVLPQWRDDG